MSRESSKSILPLLRRCAGPLLLCAAVLLVLRGADPQKEQLSRLRNLGKAFYENPTTHAEAVEQFRKALTLAPGSLRERVNYGLALLRTLNVEDGIAELEKVQKADPSIPHTWFNLGIAYKKKGQYDRAITQFERMVQLVPDEPISHYNLGVLYRYTDRARDALKELDLASRLDPNFAAPLFQIFDIHREAERTAEAERALQKFQQVKKRQEGPDASSEDPNWSYYAEIYEEIDPRDAVEAAPASTVRFEDRALKGKADADTAGLVVLDAEGAGRADLLVWSSAGLLLYRGAAEPVDAGLSGVGAVISVAVGDYDNDGLPDLCVLTADGASLYRNRKGRFEKQPASLAAGQFRKVLWLDYDHDYDLDLLLIGDRFALLRNQGPAGFQDRTKDFPFVPGQSLDAIPLRVVADAKGLDVVVSYRDRVAVLYRDRLAGLFEAVSLDAVPPAASSLLAQDLDSDGWIDLAFRRGESIGVLRNRQGKWDRAAVESIAASDLQPADLERRGLLDLVSASGVLRNEGLLRFSAIQKPAGLPQGKAWTGSDFDGDGGADLACVTRDDAIHVLLNRTASAHNWLAVSLSGVKNAKLALGSEVEVKAGALYQKQVYQGVPLTFGLRSYKEIDTVRITWPNGLIQNETRQAANQLARYKEAPKLSGSCPMIFTYNGQRFEFLTDVLGVAPLGASSGDGQVFAVDHDEYVQIPAAALAERDGRYEIRITEELAEVSYLDEIQLLAVDHPAPVDIFSNDKWKSPPFAEFRLYGVKQRIYPVAAFDEQGRNWREALRLRDRRYVGGFRRNYAGVAEMHALELDFGAAAQDNRAVLVLTGWVDWADGSTFLAAAQEGNGGLRTPSLQVKDAAGRWRTVIEDMGMPSGKTKTIAVDLTGKFLSAERKVRIVTNLCVYWDEIFLGEDASAPEARLQPVKTVRAELGFHGFSERRLHRQRKQPEHFDYGRVRMASHWNPTPGLYTRYGNVQELLAAVDDRMVIMGSGDELRLSFEARSLPPLAPGWRRDFLLKVDGWEKDRDPNTAHSQTVEPLPFHQMSGYPYPAGEKYPDDPWRLAYRREYNTRPPLRFIQPLIR